MTTAVKLRHCNTSLGLTLLLMLASGIQLEVTSGKYGWTVWVHVILGILLTGLSLYHIFLHYRFGNWFSRFTRNRNAATRILWWVFLLTVVTGMAVTVKWLTGSGHTTLGGVHGKIGFLMVIVAVVHIAGHHGRKKRAHHLR